MKNSLIIILTANLAGVAFAETNSPPVVDDLSTSGISVEVSSDKAWWYPEFSFIDPQEFDYGVVDTVNPCEKEIGHQPKALAISYSAVTNQTFQVKPYDINFTLFPSNQQGEMWKKTSGPTSGLFSINGSKATLSNAYIPGVYEFDVFYKNKTTRAKVVLPAAGAEIIEWLNDEVSQIPAWAKGHKEATKKEVGIFGPFYNISSLYGVYENLSALEFDYNIDPIDKSGLTPCRGKVNQIYTTGKKVKFNYVTLNGVVVHGSKINNMLWALFSMHWDDFEVITLQWGASRNQKEVDGENDPLSSQNAIALAGKIFEAKKSNSSVHIENILSLENIKSMQDKKDLHEEDVWPSPYKVDVSHSETHLDRPCLSINPEGTKNYGCN